MNPIDTASTAVHTRPAVRDSTIALALYLCTLVPLGFSLASQPPFLYNWEEYTVWRLIPGLQNPGQALVQSLHLTDGLMTDSGLTPALMAPLLFLGLLLGPDLWSLRLFPVTFSALAVPLTYLVGTETYGRRAGLLAALFTATSACFALYARTATNVGISLTPALATVWLLLRWQKCPTYGVSLFLGALFVLEAYFYATTRFLVLLAIPLLLLTLWRKRPANPHFHAAIVFAPLLLFLLSMRPSSPPVLGSLLEYYQGRGEQIVTMYEQNAWGVAPKQLQREPWLPESLDPKLAGAIALVKGNLERYANLFLSVDTGSATLDFWNAQGRLYHPLLTSFLLLGLALALRDWRQVDSGTLLLILFGTSLPIVLTNNVHVGRLLLSLPPLFLFAGRGFALVLDNLFLPRPVPPNRRPSARWLAALALVVFSAYWGVVRPGVWFPVVPIAVVAVAFLVALAGALPARLAMAAATALVLVILGAAAVQEFSLPMPKHYPYSLAESIRQLPGSGPVVLVSRRAAGEMGDMEVSSLAFYLRDQYAVTLGLPSDLTQQNGKRLLYDVTGYAQNPTRLPASLPQEVLLVADREVGEPAIERLQRQFGSRVLVTP